MVKASDQITTGNNGDSLGYFKKIVNAQQFQEHVQVNIRSLGSRVTDKRSFEYRLIHSLQLGIQASQMMSNSLDQLGRNEVNEGHYRQAVGVKLQLRLDSEQDQNFSWTEYCPEVFHALRRRCGVQSKDFFSELEVSSDFRVQCSQGRSRAVMYRTRTSKYIIKSLKAYEVSRMLQLLPKYAEHVFQHPNSMLPRFYGMFCVRLAKEKAVSLLVMENIFGDDNPMGKVFDLKGSKFNRKRGSNAKRGTVLLDQDLKYVYKLHPKDYTLHLQQLNSDIQFLQASQKIDYSLLLGVRRKHTAHLHPSKTTDTTPCGSSTSSKLVKSVSCYIALTEHGSFQCLDSASDMEAEGSDFSFLATCDEQDGERAYQQQLLLSSFGGSSFGDVMLPGSTNSLASVRDSVDLHDHQRDDCGGGNGGGVQNEVDLVDGDGTGRSGGRRHGHRALRVTRMSQAEYTSAAFRMSMRRGSSRRRNSLPSLSFDFGRKMVKDPQQASGKQYQTDPALDGTCIQDLASIPVQQQRFRTLDALQYQRDNPDAPPVHVTLYIGLIDILQEFSLKKKMEHAVKSMQVQKEEVTIQSPAFYGDRLASFLKQVFAEGEQSLFSPREA